MEKDQAKAALSRIGEELRRPWRENRAMELIEFYGALARHPDPDFLPEFLAAVRRIPESRRSFIYLVLADTYGKAVAAFLRAELREVPDYGRATAAQALASIGDTESRAEIVTWLIERPSPVERGPALLALLQGRFVDLAKQLLAKHPDHQVLAIAAHHGLDGAREQVVNRLRSGGPVDFGLLDQLHAWEDRKRWDSRPFWMPGDGIERLNLVVAPEIREPLDVRAMNESYSEYSKLSTLIPHLAGHPYRRWAWRWDSPGVLRVDHPDRIRDHWLRRLSD
jgi:hypothetical protein